MHWREDGHYHMADSTLCGDDTPVDEGRCKVCRIVIRRSNMRSYRLWNQYIAIRDSKERRSGGSKELIERCDRLFYLSHRAIEVEGGIKKNSMSIKGPERMESC